MAVRTAFRLFCLGIIVLMPSCSTTIPFTTTTVWRAGEGGYHTYRIPVVIATPAGTLLAFGEGRKGGQGDAGDIDLLVKRSLDGGLTWSEAVVVCDEGPNTCGNPAPVVDATTGRIHLLMTWNLGSDSEAAIMAGESEAVRQVYYSSSDDDGLTWASPQNLGPETRKADWRWYATGPVSGIQLTRGTHAGRLLIPANHSMADVETGPQTYHSHVLFSDDNGTTWQLGGTHEPYTNESTVVERVDGSVMQNMRSYHGQHQRAVATSSDGGLTWSPVRLDAALVEPICQASLIRYAWPNETYPTGVILFSNPASTSRDHMTVRASYDDGETWPVQRVVFDGSAAYSSLVVLPDKRIGLLYERNNYSEIVFATFTFAWLTGADDA